MPSVGTKEHIDEGFGVSVWMERMFNPPCVSTYQNQSRPQFPVTDRTAHQGTFACHTFLLLLDSFVFSPLFHYLPLKPLISQTPLTWGLMYKDLLGFPSKTLHSLKPSKLLLHGSKHAAFVRPNQHGIEQVCQTPTCPLPHLNMQIDLNRPCTWDSSLPHHHE